MCVNKVLLACATSLLLAQTAVAQSYKAPVCEVVKHPTSFAGQTVVINTPIVLLPIDTVIYRSHIRVDAERACKSDDDGLDLIFDEESGDKITAALLEAINAIMPVDVNSRCTCTGCPQFKVTANLEVTVKKWQKGPPPKTREGWEIDIGGEEPEYQLIVRRVLRYSANELPPFTCSD